jgi:hypothetical protein
LHGELLEGTELRFGLMGETIADAEGEFIDGFHGRKMAGAMSGVEYGRSAAKP